MAHRIKKNIFVAIRTPRGVPIDIAVGVAEYSHLTDMNQTLADTDEVEALLNIARMDCFKSNLDTNEIEKPCAIVEPKKIFSLTFNLNNQLNHRFRLNPQPFIKLFSVLAIILKKITKRITS